MIKSKTLASVTALDSFLKPSCQPQNTHSALHRHRKTVFPHSLLEFWNVVGPIVLEARNFRR